MTGTFSLVWHIEPLAPPRPIRHCATCGMSRPFRSSGKVRLNANGQRLDAWLIYKCDTCERTWNLPLLDRVPVTAIAPNDLNAMQHSDSAWVARQEQDLATLRRHCTRLETSPEVVVTRSRIPPGDVTWWSEIRLTLVATGTVGQRLDRLLAHELKLARSDLRDMQSRGGLDCGNAGTSALRRPVRGDLTLWFRASCLEGRQRAAVAASLLIN
jgi:hypothetical protein